MGIKFWNIDISKIKIASGATPRLPSAYQEVEWVWSSRTQVINTWVIPATQTYTAELEVESTQSGGEYWAFGIWGTTGFRWWQDSSWHWDTSFGASYEPSSYSLNTKTKITLSNTWKWTSSNTAIWLFWMWENGAYANNRKWAYKIYYCKIWNSWTLIRDFVPCYRISDSVIWMYDLVNDVFYTNNWSWTFTKWGDVNLPYKEIRKVYKGSTQVRPTANGLSYNFTTKPTSDLANDWWTVWTGVTTDSWWFYSGALWYPMSQIWTVDATKKITIIQEFRTWTIWSWRSTALLGLGENNNSTADANIGAVYMGLMTNRNYKLRWILYQIWDWVASNDFSWTSNTEYSATYIIDLANKEVSIEINLKSDGSTVVTTTKSLSDAEVTKFVWSPYLLTTAWGAGERIHNISVAIE